MATGKPFSGWVSGELLQQAQARVDRDYNGNVSEYVVDLIKEDVEMHEPLLPPADEHSAQLVQLSEIARRTGLDAVSIMRATLAAVVAHAEQNQGRISFPITLARPRDEVRDGAEVWAHLAQGDRDALLVHALRGDSWPQVLDAIKQETAPRLKDLRLAYVFAMSAPAALPLAAEPPQAPYVSDSSSGPIPPNPVGQEIRKHRAQGRAAPAATPAAPASRPQKRAKR